MCVNWTIILLDPLAQALSVAGPLCNASLSTYYNLIIKYGWSDHKLKRIEKWLHIVPATLGSLIAIVTRVYVPGTWGCWFGNTQYPMGCDSAETCERGWNSNYYFWPIFFLLWAAPCFTWLGRCILFIDMCVISSNGWSGIIVLQVYNQMQKGGNRNGGSTPNQETLWHNLCFTRALCFLFYSGLS